MPCATPRLRGDEHPRRADHVRAQPVAGLVDLDHAPAGSALHRLLGHRLVLGWVEGVAGGPKGLDAETPEARAEFRPHEAHAVEQRVVSSRGVERPVEVVERGQQLLGELCHAALGRGGGLARDALAVVLEVGLRALRERQILIALSGHVDQLVQVVLDLRGVLADLVIPDADFATDRRRIWARGIRPSRATQRATIPRRAVIPRRAGAGGPLLAGGLHLDLLLDLLLAGGMLLDLLLDLLLAGGLLLDLLLDL